MKSINIKLESEEDLNSLCSLVEFCLKKNQVRQERIEPVKEILQRLRTQQIDLPSNQEEIERMKSILSDMELRDSLLKTTIEKLKEFKIARDEKVMITLDEEWKALMQSLIGSVQNSERGIDLLIKQNTRLLERIGEGKFNEDNKTKETNDLGGSESQTDTSEEGDEQQKTYDESYIEKENNNQEGGKEDNEDLLI